MRILIFDWSVTGHHLEYLHHLYVGATNDPENKYIFFVPTAFQDVKNKLIWRPAENVNFQYLSDKEQELCDIPNLLISAWYKSIIVRRAVQKSHIDCVWSIMLMQLMPFLPLLLPRKVKVSGILYRIYFYEGTSIRGIRLWVEKLRYRLMVSSKNMTHIFVLNDQQATEKLNAIYHTSKFGYIPDPIPEIDDSQVHNIRKDLGIVSNEMLYLHFGGLDRRKGTLEILKAISMMSAEELEGKAFIFAGKIKESIKNEFYTLMESAESKAHIVVYDEFCSYEHLNNLCYSCDCILIPYQNTNQSSGVIGFASYFSKPVIGPKQGLLGRLIKEYHLGETYNDMSAEGIKKVLCTGWIGQSSNEYALTHTVSAFNQSFSIINGLTH